MLTLKQVLEYEVAGSWFASYISNPYLQNLLGIYYAKKAKRKYKRYLWSMEMKKQLSVQIERLKL